MNKDKKDSILAKTALYALFLIFFGLMVLLGVMSSTSQAASPAGKKSNLQQVECMDAYAAANESERGIVDMPKSRLVNKGEWDHSETEFVLREYVSECGWIYQYMDLDGDTNCDCVDIWQPIHTQNGVLFKFYKSTLTCPLCT